MAEAVLDNAEVEYALGTEPGAELPPPIRWRRLVPFLILLPLFGGTFSYVKDIRPLWYLTKAFPILSVPLVLVLLRHERVPFTRQLAITLLYMFLVPSFTGMSSFQQDFFTGLTSQVKLLPLLFFFSFLATLYLFDLTYEEVTRAFLVLAVATFAVLTMIWLFAPVSAYDTKFVLGEGSILTADSRGLRIRMPMYFGMIGIFYAYRRFFAGGQWRWLLYTGAMFALLIYAVKTRAFVIACAAILAINAFRFAKPAVRLGLIALMPVAFIGLLNVPLVASLLETKDTVRPVTYQIIKDFLGTSVWRWAFGVGSISPLDPGGMLIFFHHFFFLADVTWMGVIFEFGLVGMVLVLLIPLRGVWMARKLKLTRGDVFLGCLQDYLIYAIIGSPLTPIILAPGELTIILSVFVYFGYRLHLREA